MDYFRFFTGALAIGFADRGAGFAAGLPLGLEAGFAAGFAGTFPVGVGLAGALPVEAG